MHSNNSFVIGQACALGQTDHSAVSDVLQLITLEWPIDRYESVAMEFNQMLRQWIYHIRIYFDRGCQMRIHVVEIPRKHLNPNVVGRSWNRALIWNRMPLSTHFHCSCFVHRQLHYHRRLELDSTEGRWKLLAFMSEPHRRHRRQQTNLTCHPNRKEIMDFPPKLVESHSNASDNNK